MNEIHKEKELGYDPSDIIKETIYKTAYEAVKVAYLVHHLSGSYCNISKNHLIPLVSRLGTLITYDSVKDKKKITEEKINLESKAFEIQEVIIKTIKDNNAKFCQQVDERKSAIETAFNERIPKMKDDSKSEKMRQIVHESVEKGNSNVEMDDVDFADFS